MNFPPVCDYNHGFSGFTIMDKHFSLSTSSTLRRDEKAHLQLIKGRTVGEREREGGNSHSESFSLSFVLLSPVNRYRLRLIIH